MSTNALVWEAWLTYLVKISYYFCIEFDTKVAKLGRLQGNLTAKGGNFPIMKLPISCILAAEKIESGVEKYIGQV